MNSHDSRPSTRTYAALLAAPDTSTLDVRLDSESPQGMHIGWRIVITVILLASLTFISLWWHVPDAGATGLAQPEEQSGGNPLVLAFYYTWFDENTWTYDKVPDLPAQPYASRDRGAMGRHIDQAKQAGIDALMVAWYGPWGDSNQTEPNLAAMLDEAAARNFKIGILFETTSPFLGGPSDAIGALQHALSVHANHPAFLRVNGKPVIFFWRPHLWSVDTWRNIRQQVDPNHNSIWIAEGVDMAYQAVFDGHHLYSNTWNPPTDLDYTNTKFARWVQEARQTYGTYKYWVATVMPGYNDTKTGRGDAFARDRENGAYYERSWQAAIASNPDWIVITSFNEWPEGTYIEPSVAYGNRFLDLTAVWSQRFKSGAGTTASTFATAATATAPAVVPTPVPEPDEPTAFVTVSLLNVRAGPSTDFPVLTTVSGGTALAITGRTPTQPEWWQISFNGESGWVYAPLVRAAGPLEQVLVTEAPELPQNVVTSQRAWANVELLKRKTSLTELIP